MSTVPALPVDCWSTIAKKTTLIEAVQLASTSRELRAVVNLCARELFMQMDRHMSSCHGDDWLTRFGIPRNTASLLEQTAQVAKIVFGETKYLETPLDSSLIEEPLALLEEHIKKFKDRIDDLIPAIYRESWSHDVPFIRQLLLELTANQKLELFQAAVDSNYWEFIALFKEAGGDVPNMRLFRPNFIRECENHPDEYECIIKTARDGAARMVVELWKAGLNFFFYKNFRNGFSLLYEAVRYGRCSTVRALLATKMHPDIAHTHGTPLYAALQRSNSKETESLIRILLEAGANPDIERLDGETPMTLAIYKQNIPEIRTLASFGADLHQRAYAGGSLLHIAIQNALSRKMPTLEMVLAWISKKQLLVIKTLLDLGVDPAMRNNEGRTFVGSVLDGNNDQEEETAKFLLGLRARFSDPADLKI